MALATRTGELRDRILTYVGNNAAPWSQHAGQSGSLVFHGAAGRRRAVDIREGGFVLPLLHDPAQYETGGRAKTDGRFFGPLWEHVQTQAELQVNGFLSPSVLPPRADHAALESIFTMGAEFARLAAETGHQAPTFITLVASPWWLTNGLGDLVEALRASPLPVAMVLAAHGDPLSTTTAIQAVIECVRASRSMISLRCDLSAIGAVAHGALAGAVGTSSSVRHLFLPSKNRSGRRRRSSYVLAPRFSSYLTIEDLTDIEGVDDLFVCYCAVCDGRSVARFSDAALAQEAYFHGVLATQALATPILGRAPDHRPKAWRQHCAAALDTFDELEERAGVVLSRPNYLSAWTHIV